MNRRAEIAGAGIAGVAAAAALARRGWTVRVHEMAAAPHAAAHGVYIPAAVQQALRGIGAFEALSAYAFAPSARHVSVDGVVRSSTPTDCLTAPATLLHGALLRAAEEAGAVIETCSRAIAAEPAGFLRLKDGRWLQADLVVVADGAGSPLARQLRLPLNNPAPREPVTRIVLNRGAFRGDAWDDIWECTDTSSGMRLLYVPCGVYSCTLSFTGPPDPALWEAAFPLFAAALSSMAGAASAHPCPARLARWSTGRVAVIGDAAQAMRSCLAEGSGCAVLSATVLAERVTTAATVEAGLAEWEASMHPAAAWQQRVDGDAALPRGMQPGADLAAPLRRTG